VRDNRDGSSAIVLIDVADGRSTQLLSLPDFPSLGGFSPDGRSLIYAMNAFRPGNDANARPSENGGVYALPLDGRRSVPLVEGPAAFTSPAWAPDGRYVLFSSDRSQDMALWSVRVAAGKAEGPPALIQHDFAGRSGRFAANGTFFFERRDTLTEAYSADFDVKTLTLSTPSPLSERAIGNNHDPQPSPDGLQVAFLRQDGPQAALIVKNLDTGDERRVTQFRTAYGAHPAQWFPDGRTLLIVERQGMRKLFRKVDAASGNAQTLFDAPWNVWTGALSPDGSALYYSLKDEERRLQLVRRVLATGEESRLYQSPASPGTGLFGLSVSPDGTQLAFARNTETDGRVLTVVPSSGGPPREILKSHKLYAQGSFAWTPDGQHLVFSTEAGPNNQQLTAISVRTGEFTLLGVTMPRITSRMLSADGRRIVFTESVDMSEVHTLRNFLRSAAGGH